MVTQSPPCELQGLPAPSTASLSDFGHGIAIDNAHNAYITGGTASSDFRSQRAGSAHR
jgi:hypothetical protein